MKTCLACANCYMDDGDFVCGHSDAGAVGKLIRVAAAASGHCGPDLPKFKQHPLRSADGSLAPSAKVTE